MLRFFSFSSRQKLGHSLAVALWVAFVASFIDFVNEASPVSEMARHLAASMFVPYNAYTYGYGESAKTVSDRIAVVDLGTASLQRYRSNWPLSYGQHSRVLERIRLAKPKALFIDFQFQSERRDPSLEKLMTSLCAFKADGIPVFIAAGTETSDGLLRPELEALRDVNGEPCFKKVAVNYEPSSTDHVTWTYPLRSTVGGHEMPSAALAMAQVIRQEPLIDEHAHDSTMGLVWGGGAKENGPSWKASASSEGGLVAQEHDVATLDHYCKPPSLTDILPLQSFLASVVRLDLDHRPYCPMHKSIEAAELTAPASAEQFQARFDLLAGRIVFYGGSFDGNDFIASPLQGDIPGVYLHAQATDNLLRFGQDWRKPKMGGRWGHVFEWPVTIASFFVMAFLTYWLRFGVRFVAKRGFMKRNEKKRQPEKSAALKNPNECALFLYIEFFFEELKNLIGRLGNFYISLIVAVPVAVCILEPFVHISVIGYSSVLAACLLGELFTSVNELDKHTSRHMT